MGGSGRYAGHRWEAIVAIIRELPRLIFLSGSLTTAGMHRMSLDFYVCTPTYMYVIVSGSFATPSLNTQLAGTVAAGHVRGRNVAPELWFLYLDSLWDDFGSPPCMCFLLLGCRRLLDYIFVLSVQPLLGLSHNSGFQQTRHHAICDRLGKTRRDGSCWLYKSHSNDKN